MLYRHEKSNTTSEVTTTDKKNDGSLQD